MHVVLGLLHVGTMTFTFLLFPAAQKYFHDENVRILSAFTMATLSLTYLLAPLLISFRAVLIDQSTYAPITKIAVNAMAYNWIARTGFVLSLFGVFALYRLRPLAITERRFKH
jgi:hypothetical protein